MSKDTTWPDLPLAAWSETCDTLQLWTQIVGKVRIALTPLINHWWNATFFVTARGLSAPAMPYAGRTVDVIFDFTNHRLIIETSDCRVESFPLEAMAVADFYNEFMQRLRRLGIDIHIWTMPGEIENAIPFDRDRIHAQYDPIYAQKFWLALGFSGRPAPPPKGVTPNVASWVMAEAYSHEVSSCGFWPGNGGYGRAAFYVYAYPEPAGYGDTHLATPEAFYDEGLGQFILPYDAVHQSGDPDKLLLGFLQETYVAAAELAKWDRTALEREPADVTSN